MVLKKFFTCLFNFSQNFIEKVHRVPRGPEQTGLEDSGTAAGAAVEKKTVTEDEQKIQAQVYYDEVTKLWILFNNNQMDATVFLDSLEDCIITKL